MTTSTTADIRNEQDGDADRIRNVTALAFSASDYGLNGEPAIVDALRDDGALTISLVAVVDAQLVGHVAVSPVEVSDGARGWFGLGPISVLPDTQRQGIGAALMAAALDALRQRGAVGCVLLGDPAYYARFGFRCVADLEYPGIPAAYFQAVSFTGRFATGAVSYHPAFG